MEEFRYDERGRAVSVTLADYLMPTRGHPADRDLITEDAPSPLNPLGIKSAGEGGITPSARSSPRRSTRRTGIPGGVTRLPMTHSQGQGAAARKADTTDGARKVTP